MDLVRLINHPEQMSKETLYELRSLVALYPYYQTARLLMLQNMYLLHETSFDDELRRAALYITDRKVLFNLVEAQHYHIKTAAEKAQEAEAEAEAQKRKIDDNRTLSIINHYLDSVPENEEDDKEDGKSKPTPADAAIDYVAYLMKTESEEEKKDDDTPQMKGQDLIDNFINNEGGKIQLQDEPTYTPDMEDEEEQDDGDNSHNDYDEGYFTETLAKIYIKQGRYSKALEIIQRLNLNYPKKNAYFADQIRFLKKLIKNENCKMQEEQEEQEDNNNK